MGNVESNSAVSYERGFEIERNILFGGYRSKRTYENVQSMNPMMLRYTKNRIPDVFTGGYPLTETFLEIFAGIISFDDLMPPVIVMQRFNTWYVIRGNRRLFLAKILQKHARGVSGLYDYMYSDYNLNVVVRPYDDREFRRQYHNSDRPDTDETVEVIGQPNLERKLMSFLVEEKRKRGAEVINLLTNKYLITSVLLTLYFMSILFSSSNRTPHHFKRY